MYPRLSNRIPWTTVPLLAYLLLLSISAAAQDTSSIPAIRNTNDLQKALGDCISPFAVADRYQDIRITARLAMNARGQPLGPPRFTYITPDAPEKIKTEYKSTIVDALKRCTSLVFSSEFGSTIAGQPITLHFNERGLTPVHHVNADEESGPAAYIQPIASYHSIISKPSQSRRHCVHCRARGRHYRAIF
jgi:hypothetical protein